jgi:hypothetical protein
MKTQSTTFETGATYEMRFIGDSELNPIFKCVKRTAKTATFVDAHDGETITRKIRTWSGHETILLGNYSMAPSISSKNKAN